MTVQFRLYQAFYNQFAFVTRIFATRLLLFIPLIARSLLFCTLYNPFAFVLCLTQPGSLLFCILYNPIILVLTFP